MNRAPIVALPICLPGFRVPLRGPGMTASEWSHGNHEGHCSGRKALRVESVIPAQAGIQNVIASRYIPTRAGMTN